LLRDPNDADDAFQTVFLILARKAGGLRRKDLVANWLYGVALRVAMEARKRPRTAVVEDESACDVDARRPSPADPAAVAVRREDETRLHEEVGRLPERYRAPVVACYFEGRTHEEAAAQLNWPIGTVKGRLARARDLLRTRLERRGVTAPAALLTTALAAPDLRAAVPAALADRAVAAALAVVASPSAWMTSAALSTSTLTLSEGVIQAMFHAQIKSLAITAALAVGLLAAGAGLATAGRDAPQEPAAAVAQDAAPEPPRPAEEPRPTFVRDSLALSPMEVLKLIDETGKAVIQKTLEADVDLDSMPNTEEAIVEAHKVLDRYCDELDACLDALRTARVDDPKGRALIDAFADNLSRLLQSRDGKSGMVFGPYKDAKILDEAYFAYARSVENARRKVANDPAARHAAGEQVRSIIDLISPGLRNPKDEGVTKPLLAAYADYLEAIDPFAEEPMFRRVSADAPRPSPPGMAPSIVMDVTWRTADQFLKSYQTAIRNVQGKPIDDARAAKAMARHIERIGHLAEDLRGRGAGDALLISLADYLRDYSRAAAENPNARQAPAVSGAVNTMSLISSAGTNLDQALRQEKPGFAQGLNDFDRSLIREGVLQAMESTLDDIQRQGETDGKSQALLDLYAERLKKMMGSDEYLFPELSRPGPAAAAKAADPAPYDDGRSVGGGSSPDEARRKIAELSAALASVDHEPADRGVYEALARPSSLNAEGGATLGAMIDQVRKAMTADGGAPIPVYVDPKGLEAAGAALDSPVTIDLKGVPLKTSLRLALKQLGLAYCVRDGVLIVGSPEGIEQELMEALRELLGARPDRFILDPDGSIRPAAGAAQPAEAR
jgi:RNA polymerase sigma factor (sigma-70 family)